MRPLSPSSSLPLLEYWDSVGSTATKLGEKVSPVAQEFWGNLENITIMLAREMNKDLEDMKQMVKPHLEDFEKKWQEDVNLYYKEVTPLAQKFRNSTHQKLQELQTKLTELSRNLREKLEPFHDQLHEGFTTRLGVLKESSAGLLKFHNKTSKQLQEVHQKAKSVLEDLQEAVLPIWENLMTDVHG